MQTSMLHYSISRLFNGQFATIACKRLPLPSTVLFIESFAVKITRIKKFPLLLIVVSLTADYAVEICFFLTFLQFIQQLCPIGFYDMHSNE